MSLIKNDFFLLSEVVKKNFAAKYKDSALGILWSVLNPLVSMLILTIVFSTLFNRSVDNYPVYLLCGKAIYDFFTSACSTSMNAIKRNKNILTKTSAPKHIFIIGGIISEFFNFIITMIILVIIMFATHAPFYWDIMPLSVIPVISAIIFSFGLGLTLAICNVYYSDTAYLWRLFTFILFYGCAIFYPIEIVPEPFHQYIILNPVLWLVQQLRGFFIYGTIPDHLNIVNSLLLSTIILVFGIIVFKKYSKTLSMKF